MEKIGGKGEGHFERGVDARAKKTAPAETQRPKLQARIRDPGVGSRALTQHQLRSIDAEPACQPVDLSKLLDQLTILD